jgi:hypothetical protein
MNTLIKTLVIVAVTAVLTTACGGRSIQAAPAESNTKATVSYQAVLGKSLNDKEVLEFIASNNCSQANYLHLCNEVGIALWVSSSEIVETVYLYLNNVDGFTPYKGALPFGLKYYDIKEAVEYKLKKQGVGQDGFPNEGATPDHLHYWATYHEARMTIIYNSPHPYDEDSNIYAILISK